MKPKREQPILTVVCCSRAQCRVPPRALVPCQWARSDRLPNLKSWPLKLQSAALAAVELPLPGRVGGCSICALRSSCPRLHCVSWPWSLACGFLFVMHHPSSSPFPSLISLNTSNNNRNRRRHHHRHTATREQHRMHATLTVNVPRQCKPGHSMRGGCSAECASARISVIAHASHEPGPSVQYRPSHDPSTVANPTATPSPQNHESGCRYETCRVQTCTLVPFRFARIHTNDKKTAEYDVGEPGDLTNPGILCSRVWTKQDRTRTSCIVMLLCHIHGRSAIGGRFVRDPIIDPASAPSRFAQHPPLNPRRRRHSPMFRRPWPRGPGH